MHILYIGYYTSDELLYEIQRRGINNMSVARQKYETNLITGLIEVCGKKDELHLLSYVPVDETFSAPAFSELCGKRVTHIPINRRSLSSLRRAQKAFVAYLRSLGDDLLRDLRVLMYEVNPLFLVPLLRMKKKYGFTLVTLCAELSILRRSAGWKQKMRNRLFAYYEKKFDAYILFAGPMAKMLKCENKPHVVIEGIAPELFGKPHAKEKNILLYAGGFGSDNNLPLLMQACEEADEVAELWICGTGKDKPLVEEAAENSKKISYFGAVTNERVRELEQEAKFLVNLRDPLAPITKYSFPSKILEYMASGTPVLSTRLFGIPEDYFQYLIPIDSLEKEDLISLFRAAMTLSDEAYLSRAAEAQDFVAKNKNKTTQAGRALSFLRSIEPYQKRQGRKRF